MRLFFPNLCDALASSAIDTSASDGTFSGFWSNGWYEENTNSMGSDFSEFMAANSSHNSGHCFLGGVTMVRTRVLLVKDDESMQEFHRSFFQISHKDEFEWRLAQTGE